MKYNKDSGRFPAFFAAFLIFLFLDPYLLWDLQKTTPLYTLLKLLLLFVFFQNASINTKGRGGLFGLFSILLILSTLYEDLNIVGVVGTLCYLFVPFAKEKFARMTFDYFLTIYSVIVGISSVVWILSIFGYVHPLGVISPLNELKSYNYNVYPFLVRSNMDYGLFQLERFCGPFDEPGVIGTISVLVLTIGKFNLKDKRLLLVFITGILTMSFFYYVAVMVYYVIYTFTVSNQKKLGFLIIAIVTVLVVLLFNNEFLQNTLWKRFIWDSDSGLFAGDDRMSDYSRNRFESLIGTFSFYFGMGKTSEFIASTGGEASLLNTIVQFGLFFVLTYIGIFAVYGWKYKKSIISYLLFLFVFLGCLYQRPFLFQPEFLFLFSLMAITCGDTTAEKKTNITELRIKKQVLYK